jgi:hypothetical protein
MALPVANGAGGRPARPPFAIREDRSFLETGVVGGG